MELSLKLSTKEAVGGGIDGEAEAEGDREADGDTDALGLFPTCKNR